MERRHFLKLAFGFAAGAAAFTTGAQAVPLMPHPLAEDGRLPPPDEDARPAVTTGDEVEQLKPEEVRSRRHWGWRRRIGAGAAVIGAGVVATGAAAIGFRRGTNRPKRNGPSSGEAEAGGSTK